MDAWIFLGAAALLSVERVCYVWIWRRPHAFRALATQSRIAWLQDPVDALRALFYAFKGLQVGVFLSWCYLHGDGALTPATREWVPTGLGCAMLISGQLLNVSVFYRLGKVGVFYGNRFGASVEWCRTFPFSVFDHPQYVGALLSIWGFFVIMRFPQSDWYVLPMLETIYYGVGARLER